MLRHQCSGAKRKLNRNSDAQLFLYLSLCILKDRNINAIIQGPGKTSSGIPHILLLNHDKDRQTRTSTGMWKVYKKGDGNEESTFLRLYFRQIKLDKR